MGNGGRSDVRKSILDDVGEIIDSALGLAGEKSLGKARHYRHRKSYQRLSTAPVVGFKGEALIGAIYEKVKSNLTGRTPSGENWRLTVNPAKKDEAKAKNRDRKLEVKLERRIIQLPGGWFNQVPTASGLVSNHSDKRGSIDLIQRCSDGSYEFIELKITSNNPLFAAMEILQYGILYVLARKNKQIRDACNEKELLQAKTIHLKVLAPTAYYDGCKLSWLENGINRGFKDFLKSQDLDLRMTFGFEEFPSCFEVKKDSFPEDDVIRKALSNRRSVYP